MLLLREVALQVAWPLATALPPGHSREPSTPKTEQRTWEFHGPRPTNPVTSRTNVLAFLGPGHDLSI